VKIFVLLWNWENPASKSFGKASHNKNSQMYAHMNVLTIQISIEKDKFNTIFK